MTNDVVFLHGGTAGGWMWDRQVAELPDRTTFAPDIPGYLTRRAEEWTSFDAVTDRLAAMIADRTTGAVDVVGLSMGGIVSLHLAQRHPQLVASVFATGVSVLPYTRGMRVGNAATLALWNRRFYWAGVARTMGLDGDGAKEFIEQSPPLTRAGARAQLREVEPGGVTRLTEISAPVMALVGEQESQYSHRSLREIRTQIPGAEVGLAPGMHHGWSGEDPRLFNRILRSWLDARARHPELLPAR
ncbi:alpha/beta fold hydrolase [Microbacterium gubbeenense]|uniref:alpha/beta fold hydrolase n=1 Tax=Microbacterium gubbeenense TaxID=159896 RepID=UPI003F969DEF